MSRHRYGLPTLAVVAILAALSATSPGQLIAVLGNNTEISPGDFSPGVADHTDFGSVDVASGFVDRTFVIRNEGSQTLVVLALQRLGLAAGDFTIPVLPALRLPRETQTSFTVRFNPSFIGPRNASIRIQTNATNAPLFEFAIRGTGTVPEPEITVLGEGREISDGDPFPARADGTDFGEVDLAGDPATHTFVIRNDGDASLSLSRLEFQGGQTSDFSITRVPSATIPAGSESSFGVRFKPGATGLRSTTLRILNNDTNENPFDFVIQGTGTTIAPELTLKGRGLPIPAGDNSPRRDDLTQFDAIGVHEGSRSHTFTIENSGTSALTITSVSIVGSAAADFGVTDPPPGDLVPGQSIPLVVTFNPSARGMRSATLRLVSNDPVTPTYEVALLGAGGRFRITRIERQGNDAIIHFTTSPDTTVSTYIYSIRHGDSLDTLTTITSFASPGGTTEQYRHLGGFSGPAGYWQIQEVTIP